MNERIIRYMCDCRPRSEIILDRFLILPRGRRNAKRRAPKRANGEAALGSNLLTNLFQVPSNTISIIACIDAWIIVFLYLLRRYIRYIIMCLY